MQIIKTATLNEFQNALGLNRRVVGKRSEQIDTNLCSTGELVLQITAAFWAANPSSSYAGISDFLAQRAEIKHKVEAFYKERCIIRLCYHSDPVQPVRAVGGYIVLNGNLLAFHNCARGVGTWMLDHAIADGAKQLVCADVPHLRGLYGSRGFVFSGYASAFPGYKGAPLLMMGLQDVQS